MITLYSYNKIYILYNHKREKIEEQLDITFGEIENILFAFWHVQQTG